MLELAETLFLRRKNQWVLNGYYYIIFQTTIFYYQIVSGEEFLETMQQTLSGISSKFLTPIFQLPFVPFHVCFLTWKKKQPLVSFSFVPMQCTV